MTMSFVRLIGSWWLMLISCMKKKSMKKEDVVITTFSIEVEGMSFMPFSRVTTRNFYRIQTSLAAQLRMQVGIQ
jgi:hypothetical protein